MNMISASAGIGLALLLTSQGTKYNKNDDFNKKVALYHVGQGRLPESLCGCEHCLKSDVRGGSAGQGGS
jgi:hypothetical protein